MVSVAFVLFTVSTLAVHGQGVPTDGPVLPPECSHRPSGQTYCNVKGDDYPHHEIDRLLARNMTFVHRMKRQAAEYAYTSTERGDGNQGNCETETKLEKPFYLVRQDTVPVVIVQSKFFEQAIPQVRCKIKDASCFEGLVRDGADIKTKCVQKTINSKIITYVNNELMEFPTLIDIDCVCTFEFK